MNQGQGRGEEERRSERKGRETDERAERWRETEIWMRNGKKPEKMIGSLKDRESNLR